MLEPMKVLFVNGRDDRTLKHKEAYEADAVFLIQDDGTLKCIKNRYGTHGASYDSIVQFLEEGSIIKYRAKKEVEPIWYNDGE